MSDALEDLVAALVVPGAIIHVPDVGAGYQAGTWRVLTTNTVPTVDRCVFGGWVFYLLFLASLESPRAGTDPPSLLWLSEKRGEVRVFHGRRSECSPGFPRLPERCSFEHAECLSGNIGHLQNCTVVWWRRVRGEDGRDSWRVLQLLKNNMPPKWYVCRALVGEQRLGVVTSL